MEHFNNLRKIVLVVEYNGRNYYGFQWQADLPTVQEAIEKAVLRLTGEERRISAACRTDTGVHARGQVVCFRTASALAIRSFLSGLNHYLPDDIAVRAAGEVSSRFNVMKDVSRREYMYLMLNSRSRSALDREFCYTVHPKLDDVLMDRASKLLVGEHDFASFVTAWDRQESTVRRIYEAGVERNGEAVIFKVIANAFLTHQVRNTVGTLIRVGMGKISLEEFNNILQAKQLSLAWPTAPAHGLCLIRVDYADNSEFKYENLCT